MRMLRLERSAFCLFFMVTVLLSQTVIKVGSHEYDSKDISALMQQYGLELPAQAVERLRRNEIMQQYARAKGVNTASAESTLYAEFYGVDIETDKVKLKVIDLPEMQRTPSARMDVYLQWLTCNAQKVPLIYVDMGGYWNLVSTTRSFKVRVEAGMKLSPQLIPYAAAELHVDSTAVLALRGGQSFIRGAELNAYIDQNYDMLQCLSRRDRPAPEACNLILRKITGEKALVEGVDAKMPVIDALEIERAMVYYCDQQMLLQRFYIGSYPFVSASQLLDTLRARYATTNAVELASLRAVLQGRSSLDMVCFTLRNFARNIALQVHRAIMLKQVTDEEAYDWMKGRKFSGTVTDAKLAITEDKFDSLLEQTIVQGKIEIRPLTLH